MLAAAFMLGSCTICLGAEVGYEGRRLYCCSIGISILCFLHVSRQFSLASAPAQQVLVVRLSRMFCSADVTADYNSIRFATYSQHDSPAPCPS